MTTKQQNELRERIANAQTDIGPKAFTQEKCEKLGDHLSLYLLEAIANADTPADVSSACCYAMEEMAHSLRAADTYEDELCELLLGVDDGQVGYTHYDKDGNLIALTVPKEWNRS